MQFGCIRQAPPLPSEEIWIEAEAATAIIEAFKTFDDDSRSVEFTLAPGSHTLLIGHREELALLDAIVITSDVD